MISIKNAVIQVLNCREKRARSRLFRKIITRTWVKSGMTIFESQPASSTSKSKGAVKFQLLSCQMALHRKQQLRRIPADRKQNELCMPNRMEVALLYYSSCSTSEKKYVGIVRLYISFAAIRS